MRELIYKDEAYNAIDNCIRDSWYRISPAEAKMNIKHLVSDINIPSETRPIGEWIAYTGMQPPELHGKHYCSNCHHALHLALNGGVYDFCPSCGYQMIKRT